MLYSGPVPWRSVWLPRSLAGVALIAGLPLYLRSPLWCDVTLYDLAVRNLQEGGVHYRDLFDTNLPGFVWLLSGLRWLFGSGSVVVRLADLAIVAGVVVLIDRLAKWGGATRASRWWALAGIAFLYPFSVELVHAQRDVWMTLPALMAILFRVRRCCPAPECHAIDLGVSPPSESLAKQFRAAAQEGVFWGLAVWLKPHIVLMAVAVWLLTIRRLTARTPHVGKSVVADLLGNLFGGLVVGFCGIAWLVESGTWPHFWSVLSVWNPHYTELARAELPDRLSQELFWLPPWSLWLIPTVPLALLSLVDAAPWRGLPPGDATRPGPVGRLLPRWLWDHQAGWNARFARGVLAGLYLVWAIQAFVIQRGFIYVHMPETLLMLGLWAAHRWAMPFIPLAWLLFTSSLWLWADTHPHFDQDLRAIATDKATGDLEEEHFLVRHPLADPQRMVCWAQCWRWDLTEQERYELWDCLRQIRDHEAAIDWRELHEVAEFLRQQGVKDREVIAWNDSPHAIYLLLGVKPGVRFMHISTARAIGEIGNSQVQKELAATTETARFAIGDLAWACAGTPQGRQQLFGPPQSPDDLLPEDLKPWYRTTFPFNQPTVFRTRGGQGRYTVHKLIPPFGEGPARP